MSEAIKEIQINQKESKLGRWVCYATFGGYDHSYEAVKIEDAQLLMSKALAKHGYTALFLSPVKYVPEPFIPKGFRRMKLYNIS